VFRRPAKVGGKWVFEDTIERAEYTLDVQWYSIDPSKKYGKICVPGESFWVEFVSQDDEFYHLKVANYGISALQNSGAEILCNDLIKVRIDEAKNTELQRPNFADPELLALWDKAKEDGEF
jgi:hypothetical protein